MQDRRASITALPSPERRSYASVGAPGWGSSPWWSDSSPATSRSRRHQVSPSWTHPSTSHRPHACPAAKANQLGTVPAPSRVSFGGALRGSHWRLVLTVFVAIFTVATSLLASTSTATQHGPVTPIANDSS